MTNVKKELEKDIELQTKNKQWPCQAHFIVRKNGMVSEVLTFYADNQNSLEKEVKDRFELGIQWKHRRLTFWIFIAVNLFINN